jgi:ribulose-5-phosphate 4-epimerase/fuculose-1-phosphate aldolase
VVVTKADEPYRGGLVQSVTDLEGPRSRWIDISDTAPETGIGIHAPIHRPCPQVSVGLHTHQPWTTALAMQAELHLVAISQTSPQITDRVVYDERYEGLADLDEGERLAKVLGTNDVMFLRHHGILVAGRELGAATDDLYMLDKTGGLP